jgi:hypothetical protein
LNNNENLSDCPAGSAHSAAAHSNSKPASKPAIPIAEVGDKPTASNSCSGCEADGAEKLASGSGGTFEPSTAKSAEKPEIIETLTIGGETCGLDTNFRENPRLYIRDMAENPVEVFLLKHIVDFDAETADYLRLAARCYDPNVKVNFMNVAKSASQHMMKLCEAFNRGRQGGKQEVIVRHQESDGRPLRRSSGNRATPRNASPRTASPAREAV